MQQGKQDELITKYFGPGKFILTEKERLILFAKEYHQIETDEKIKESQTFRPYRGGQESYTGC